MIHKEKGIGSCIVTDPAMIAPMGVFDNQKGVAGTVFDFRERDEAVHECHAVLTALRSFRAASTVAAVDAVIFKLAFWLYANGRRAQTR